MVILALRMADVRILASSTFIFLVGLRVLIRPFGEFCSFPVCDLFNDAVLAVLVKLESPLHLADEVLALLCKGILVVLDHVEVEGH
jgi:hypothetical protein